MTKIHILGASHPSALYLLKKIKKERLNYSLYSSRISMLNEKGEEGIEYHNFLHNCKSGDTIISFSPIDKAAILLKRVQDKNIYPSKTILLSSSSIYSKLEKKSIDKNEYLHFKKGELLIKNIYNYSKNKTKYYILRSTMIWGDKQDKNINVISKFICKYHFFPLSSKCNGMRSPVHFKDLSAIIFLLINYADSKNYRIFDIHGNENITYQEIINLFIKNKKIKGIYFSVKIPYLFILSIAFILNLFPSCFFLKKVKGIVGALLRQKDNLIYKKNDIYKFLDYKVPVSFKNRINNTYFR
tara:strand:- start:4491 stop:5387 length:897 start_codon:yes stop_codon:yes gene_type:complete